MRSCFTGRSVRELSAGNSSSTHTCMAPPVWDPADNRQAEKGQRRTMGLILRSWPLTASSSAGDVDGSVAPSPLATADGGMCRGLKASEPWTEPEHGGDRSRNCGLHKTDRVGLENTNISRGWGGVAGES